MGDIEIAAATVQFLPENITKARLKKIRRMLTTGTAARTYFERCYQHADDFSFSPDFLSERTVEWLGSTHTVSPWGIEVMMHHVLVTDRFHGTRSVHQHIAVNSTASLEPHSETLQQVVRVLHAIYWSPLQGGEIPTWLQQLDPFMSAFRSGSGILPSSRQIYTSVLLPPDSKGLVADWEEVAEPLYGLLYLHAEGIDKNVALETLRRARWQTASFYACYAQPDGVLSVSVPYPHDPLPWTTLVPWSESDFSHADAELVTRLETFTPRFEPYDLLPEFPMLRYSSLALLEYLGNAEHEQWRIRKQLDRMARLKWPFSVIAGVTRARALDRSYSRTTSLHMIRLPVVRETAQKLLDGRTLSMNEKAIESMRANLLNDLMTILAGLAILVPVVQVVIEHVTK